MMYYLNTSMIKTIVLALPIAALSLASCSSNNIAVECQKFKEEMASNLEEMTSSVQNFDGSSALSSSEKNEKITKRFLQAIGIGYKEGASLEAVKANTAGIMEGAVKCKEAGVDISTW